MRTCGADRAGRRRARQLGKNSMASLPATLRHNPLLWLLIFVPAVLAGERFVFHRIENARIFGRG